MQSLPILLPGVALVVFNSITGHQLYHVNTLKLFMLGIILSLLWSYALVFHRVSASRSLAGWQWGLLLFLPTIGFLPGGWFNPKDSVYFPIELVTDLLAVGWAVLLIRLIDSEKAVYGFLLWLVVLCLVVALWVGSQGIATHPLSGELVLYNRPEGTFGNVNYLAGFLAVMLPFMLLLALPDYDAKGWHWEPLQRLITVGLIALVFSIILAYSRAAIAATLVACMGSLLLVGLTSPMRKMKQVTFVIVTLGVTGLGLLVVLPYFVPEILAYYPSRFAKLYDIGTWWGRLVPVRGAMNSILASPFIGWGLGSSYNLNFTFIPSDAALYLSNVSYNHLHNEWLEMAQEGGALGMLLWGSVITTLVVLLLRFSMRQQHLFRYMAIGIIGGLIAFYTHGLFSVAQRMIVANLPLYTLLGLAGALLINERKGQQWFNWQGRIAAHRSFAPLGKHLRSWQVVVVGLLVMWMTFYPWIRSFGGMVELNSRGAPIAERIAFFDKWPNPYGLSDLLNRQIAGSQFTDAKITGKKVRDVLPNYRQLDARLSEVEINLGNIQAARALAYQQYQLSNFLPSSNLILTAIDLVNDDRENFVFFLQQLLVHALVSRSSQFNSSDQIEFDQEGKLFALRELADDRVAISLPPAYIDTWFALAGNPEQLKGFTMQTLSQLSMSKFFLPDVENRRRLVELLNQTIALGDKQKKEIAKKQQTYQILNQNRRISSFQIKADMSRIDNDIEVKIQKQRNVKIKQIDKLLADAKLDQEVRAGLLFDRIGILRSINSHLNKVVILNNHLQKSKG